MDTKTFFFTSKKHINVPAALFLLCFLALILFTYSVKKANVNYHLPASFTSFRQTDAERVQEQVRCENNARASVERWSVRLFGDDVTILIEPRIETKTEFDVLVEPHELIHVRCECSSPTSACQKEP